MRLLRNHIEMQKAFLSRTFKLDILNAKFNYNGDCIASLTGCLCVGDNDRLVLNVSDELRFARNKTYSSNDLQTDAEIVGYSDYGAIFKGKPQSKGHLIEFIQGMREPQLSFHDVEITEIAETANGGRTIGYVNYLPDWLFNESTEESNHWEMHSHHTSVKGSLDGNRYLLEITPTSDYYDPPLIVGAALYALSLMAGTRIEWHCFTTQKSFETQSIFVQRSLPTNKFYQLFDFPSREKAKLVFELAHIYFCENPESMMPRLMGTLWDFSSSDFEVRSLLLGVALEGIAKDVIFKEPPLSQIDEDFKTKVLSALSEKSAQSLFLTEDEKNRLLGIVRAFNPDSTKRIIRAAFDRVGKEISQKQLKSWSAIRNKRGHGKLNWNFPSREELANYLVCVDLVNNLVLGLIGIENTEIISSMSASILWELEKQSK